MCDQRERLIGYVYDECEPGERAEVQQHLESCATCQTEIAALRSVRTDLQGWEVPDHESVWKPFAPAQPVAWWTLMPRWMMAAAAGLVVISGAAGGAATYALVADRPAPDAIQDGRPTVTAEDLAAVERRIHARLDEQMSALDGRVRLVSSRPLPPNIDSQLHSGFEQQLAELRATSMRQIDAINAIYLNLGQMRKGIDFQHAALSTRVSNLATVVEQSR